MSELPRIYSVIECAKCGKFKDVATFETAGVTKFTYRYMCTKTIDRYHGEFLETGGEFMLVTCGHCGYSWMEACADGK